MRLSPLLLAIGLAGCAGVPSGDVLKPNANLVLQNVPPVPASLQQTIEPYTDFRGHFFVDWHPTKREMLVAHRGAGRNTNQLYVVNAPLAEPQPLTDFDDPVTEARYEPREGKYIVFDRSVGGNEATQLFRMDLNNKAVVQMTAPDERSEFHDWLHGRSEAIVSSVPLDRTAQGGTRATISTVLWQMDPMNPALKRKVAELPGTGWFGGQVAPDDRQLAITRYVSATESQVWTVDLASGATKQLLPAAGAKPATHFVGGYAKDGALYVLSDRAGEFNELVRFEPASGRIDRITGHIPWDVSGATATEDGTRLALQVNVDGRDELRLFDARTLKELPAPALPAGAVGATRFHKRSGELAFSINGAQGPSQLYTLDAAGKPLQWTRAGAPPALASARFSEPAIVRWTSFDGRSISGLIHRPPARFAGKRPVLINIHGGPEGQATMGFIARNNYLVDQLGITMIQPNVRGSSGYGKSFLALDNGRLREDSVKDIGALLDWIAQQPDLDASRVAVTGGSYGGYMSLAVAATYPQRIAGAIDVVGISHFVTFLESTESYRRDLRRSEYGDERDPEMRKFLDSISPLTRADRITKPLLVVQGRNDPRVPYTEAEQIVAKVRANGTPVWYLRAENEGHGFQRKENADYYFYVSVLFLQQTLLKQ